MECKSTMAECISNILQHTFDYREDGAPFGILQSNLKDAVSQLLEEVNLVVHQLNTSDEEDLELTLTSLIESIGWIVKTHGGMVSNLIIDMVAPVMATMLATTTISHVRAQAICCIDDIIEHGQVDPTSFLPAFLPYIQQVYFRI